MDDHGSKGLAAALQAAMNAEMEMAAGFASFDAGEVHQMFIDAAARRKRFHIEEIERRCWAMTRTARL
jgi:hypothetical protein